MHLLSLTGTGTGPRLGTDPKTKEQKMIRNLKTIGLALVAVLAVSAMTASAASAQKGKLTSDGPVTLHIKENPAPAINALTSFGSETKCPNSSYTGHKYNVTPHGLIASGETTATITPHYNQAACTSGTFSSTVDMNGCDYVFHVGNTTGGVAGTYGVTADVVCPVGGHIVVTVWSGETHVAPEFIVCTVTVKPQTGLIGPHLTNQAGGQHVLIKGTFNNVHVTRSGACTGGPTQTTTEGQFHIDATISGTNAAGGATAINISH
jgi:hypothetical protein